MDGRSTKGIWRPILTYLILTGASHTGKTLLAQKMLEKYKYPYLSIDHLKMGLIRSGNTELTPEDDEALTGYLWPIIREIVKTAIENKQNLIIEGCYIPFDWRRDFEERYLSSIRFICLAMSENYIENHFGEIIGYESEIEARMIDADCTKDSLKADNRDNHTIYVEFLCVTDCEKERVTLQEGETSAFKWVAKDKLISMKKDELVTERMQRFVDELRPSKRVILEV